MPALPLSAASASPRHIPGYSPRHLMAEPASPPIICINIYYDDRVIMVAIISFYAPRALTLAGHDIHGREQVSSSVILLAAIFVI